jgi:8-oxo-dGTP pyrophosphatase MutT (NUDIX family)
MGEWLRRDSRLVYENAWMRLREDAVVRPDGSTGVYGVVVKPDFALIIPFDGEAFVLVEQFRYPVAGRYWEFPQGSWEGKRDTDPLELAAGELREETGLRAGSLRHLGHLFATYGYSTHGFDAFLATELTADEQALEATEQDLVVGRFTRAGIHDLIRTGALKDAMSLAALALLDLPRQDVA